ncbi:MAG: HNH endonuclease [Barrevirus sp.]|uniref:HNH endonuclease n=1 Tax=Barrevirus sp. TaxID=2487763 RepID=A0A3G4ZTL3_9VIRU|nr:MAG: HNH endonuclease [Barrevirus sp.]
MSGENVPRKIYQYNGNYKIIRSWNSVKEILGSNSTYISAVIHKCLKGLATFAYQYIWSYDKNLVKPIIVVIDEKIVYQFTLEGDFVKKWASLKEIINSNKKYKKLHIDNNLNGHAKTAYGSIWSYNENITKPIIKVEVAKLVKQPRKIYQYDANYVIIKCWDSMVQILAANKSYTRSRLDHNLYGNNKSAYSYIWSYDANLKKPIKNFVIDDKYILDKDNYIIPNDGKEYWKYVFDYGKRYLISNFGKIYSCISDVLMSFAKEDYLRLKLTNANSKETMCCLHILVAKHFVLNPKKLPEVNHIDKNKYNANYKNLEWMTASENSQAYHDTKVQFEILQYNSDGVLIKEWKSVKEIIAANPTYTVIRILKNINGYLQHAYNFIWKYKNKPKKKTFEVIIDKNKPETWKNLGKIDDIDFSGYDISSYGRVRNIKRKIILSPSIVTGYYQISLTDTLGNAYMRRGHILVATRFCKGKTDIKNEVNHLDKNRLNNHYTNLEWNSHQGNIIHSVGRKVNQINIKTGKIIKTFDTAIAAAKEMNPNLKSASGIINVCKGRQNTSYGYKWQYA